MTYPFHDCGDEVIEGRLIRRARLHVDGHWMCIRPGQSWEDGDVRPLQPYMQPCCTLCLCLHEGPAAFACNPQNLTAPSSWPRSEEQCQFTSDWSASSLLTLSEAGTSLPMAAERNGHLLSEAPTCVLKRCGRRWPLRWSWSTVARRIC